jgi:hypothetical protein
VARYKLTHPKNFFDLSNCTVLLKKDKIPFIVIDVSAKKINKLHLKKKNVLRVSLKKL